MPFTFFINTCYDGRAPIESISSLIQAVLNIIHINLGIKIYFICELFKLTDALQCY